MGICLSYVYFTVILYRYKFKRPGAQNSWAGMVLRPGLPAAGPASRHHTQTPVPHSPLSDQSRTTRGRDQEAGHSRLLTSPASTTGLPLCVG